MIMFVGQVARHMKGREAFQEVDYRAVFGTLAKWATEIDDPARVPEIVSHAFHVAANGRPGPVVIALTEDMLTDTALVSVADLVRRYHLAVASFDPAGYAWPRPIPSRFRTGLVSHNDVHPANLVFRDGRAVALIDFDWAGPGSAAWDFAAAARYWAPLQGDEDIPDSRQGRALERFRIFLEASGLTRAVRRQVAEAVVANHDWTYAIVTEAAAAGHQGFADYWHKVMEPTVRARRWCLRHQRDLLAAAG